MAPFACVLLRELIGLPNARRCNFACIAFTITLCSLPLVRLEHILSTNSCDLRQVSLHAENISLFLCIRLSVYISWIHISCNIVTETVSSIIIIIVAYIIMLYMWIICNYREDNPQFLIANPENVSIFLLFVNYEIHFASFWILQSLI